jgi:predicted PurR-regulated permease PerM
MTVGRKRPSISYLRILWGIGLVVAILYLGKPLLVPLSLAVLFTFILTPVVETVQRSGLPRVPSVLAVLFLSLVLAALIGWGVGAQLNNLAKDLPTHTEEVREKIANLRQAGSEKFSRLFRMYEEIGASDSTGTSPASAFMPSIVVQNSSPVAIENFSTLAGVILEPIATTLLVMILVGFMLIRREDLRNRVIGLLGHGQLAGTTRVTVEAAERLSKFLLAQLLVNASFGLVFGTVLFVIGVPYSLLWGLLMALLRFVPYVGPWTAAVGPILLSVAIFPDWLHPLVVLAIFVVLELITANVIEPVVMGHSTGVSPVALLIAAAFWIWVWGPVGLFLSTPLTACMVVLGQHVPRFRFLATLLDDQPALEPHVSYYQRLLAGDRNEAAQLIAEFSHKSTPIEVFDGVLLPTLLRTRRDRKHAGLTAGDETFIFDATQQALDQFVSAGPIAPLSEAPLVFACPAHHRGEELSLTMLAQALGPQGYRVEIASTHVLPVEIESRLAARRPAIVFIAVLPPGGLIQARYLCKRLRKRFPELVIIVGYWGRVRNFDRLLVRLRTSGANYVTTSIAQSRGQITALLGSSVPPENPIRRDINQPEKANV